MFCRIVGKRMKVKRKLKLQSQTFMHNPLHWTWVAFAGSKPPIGHGLHWLQVLPITNGIQTTKAKMLI